MPDSRPNNQLFSNSFFKTKQQQIKSFVPITACDTWDTDCPKFPPIILRKTNRKAHEQVDLRPDVKEEHRGSSPGLSNSSGSSFSSPVNSERSHRLAGAKLRPATSPVCPVRSRLMGALFGARKQF